MNAPITYRPWIPKDGQKPVFDILCQKLGKVEEWPANVRETVCERGDPLPFRMDPNCTTGYYVVDTSQIVLKPGYWKSRC